jgi:hypothetical protein
VSSSRIGECLECWRPVYLKRKVGCVHEHVFDLGLCWIHLMSVIYCTPCLIERHDCVLYDPEKDFLPQVRRELLKED